MGERELRRLEIVRQLLFDRLLDYAPSGKPYQGLGLGDIDVTHHGETGGYAPGGRIGQNRDVRYPRLMQRRDAGKAVKTAGEYSEQTKEEFQKKLEAQLNELDAKIAKLREKGRDLKDEAKVKWDRKMTELETKREAASAKLAEVGHSSAEAWKDVQKGAQSAWDDLDKAFRDASREF